MPSGRFQARYCIDLVWHSARTTFRTKRVTDAYLASVRSEVDRGSWIDPDADKVTFDEYSSRWLAERPHLRPRTRELYEGELRPHILPSPTAIDWVHAVFATAVEDGIVVRNPCLEKGASTERRR